MPVCLCWAAVYMLSGCINSTTPWLGKSGWLRFAAHPRRSRRRVAYGAQRCNASKHLNYFPFMPSGFLPIQDGMNFPFPWKHYSYILRLYHVKIWRLLVLTTKTEQNWKTYFFSTILSTLQFETESATSAATNSFSQIYFCGLCSLLNILLNHEWELGNKLQ